MQVNRFCDNFERMARDRGMNLGVRIPDVNATHCRSGSDVVNILEKTKKDAELQGGLQVGLIVCIIGNTVGKNAQELYPAIKRWSHVIAGVPTQCLQQGKALGKFLHSKTDQYAIANRSGNLGEPVARSDGLRFALLCTGISPACS